MKNILFVIPDMGGQYAIVKKNLRILSGKPLISYVIEAAKRCKWKADIVVVTNDDAMLHVCDYYSIPAVHSSVMQNDGNSEVTLDPIICKAVLDVENDKQMKYDIIVTLQPTSPLIKSETIDSGLDMFMTMSYDTILSAINQPHLAWERQGTAYIPKYTERRNRKLLPDYLVETGTFVICNRENLNKGSRIGESVYIFQIAQNEGLEIINEYDWLIAEKELSKKKILIRIDGYSEIGMGHIYRGLQLADILFEHEVCFVISEKSDIAIQRIEASGYPYIIIKNDEDIIYHVELENADIVVNDILNTSLEYMRELTRCGVRVVNLEDLGEGAVYADAVINDLYSCQNQRNNFYWGSDYYCLREAFLNIRKKKNVERSVQEVLVSFGGTDPSHLTEKIISIFNSFPKDYFFHVTVIIGAGNSDKEKVKKLIAENANNISYTLMQDVKTLSIYMSQADLAIASQGRTMYELAYMTVPTIIMAQNERELTHEFGYLSNGFINLGLGKELDDKTIYQTILWLINCPQIRVQIKNEMEKLDLENGVYRVKKLILGE